MKKNKKKLKLEELKVQSFVTKLDKTDKETVEGGTQWTTTLATYGAYRLSHDAIGTPLTPQSAAVSGAISEAISAWWYSNPYCA